VAVPSVQTIRLTASIALRDRLLVAVTKAAAVVSSQGFSGLIVVDRGCGRIVRTLKLAYRSALLVGKDTEAYLSMVGSATVPLGRSAAVML
jgi:hypothetical protein